MIGKFEELILLALVRSGPKSTPAEVYKTLASSLDNIPAFGAAFTCLNRMEKKGWVTVTLEAGGPDEKQRRKFSITGEGSSALNEALTATKLLSGNYIPA